MSPLVLCCLLALPASAAQADTLDGTVHGRIVSEATGAPVPHALVLMEHPSRPRSTLSDSAGNYRLEAVPPGARQIRVGAPGHIPLEVVARVPAGRELVIDVVLPIRPISMPEITAVGELEESGGHLRARATSLRAAPEDPELRALEASPAMAQLGFRETGTGPPEEDGSGLLHVRGGASDFKLVLLDGAPVYAPFHLAGLDDAAHPGVLESSRLFVGGAPARFGGALSHVLLLETRRGGRDGFGTAGAMDLLGGRARVDGNVGSSISYLAATRRLHGGEPVGLTERGLPYGYHESLGRVDVDPSRGTHLAATAFRNREMVRLDGPDLVGASARWGNTAGSVRLHARPGPRDAVFTAAIGRFESRLPLSGGATGSRSGASERVRLAADISRREGSLRIGYGIFYGRDAIALRTDLRSDTAGGGTGGGGTGSVDGRTGWRVGTVAEEAGAYGELLWRPEARLSVRGGLRADAFLSAGRLRLGPRLAAEWRAGESSILSAAVGRYHQYVRPPETILSAGPGDLGTAGKTPPFDRDDGEPTGSLADALRGARLSVAEASHVVVGLRHHTGRHLGLGMEGYYRIYRGLPGGSGRRASGVDLWFDWEDGPWRVGAGYSLLFSWLEDADPATARRFSGRQLLATALEAPLPSGLALELRLANAAGLPFTPLPTASDTGPEAGSAAEDSPERGAVVLSSETSPAERSASYLRLDATISGTWNTTVLGTELDFTPYLRVLNALDRRDALFYRFGGEPGPGGEARSLSSVPLLPVIGVEWTM